MYIKGLEEVIDMIRLTKRWVSLYFSILSVCILLNGISLFWSRAYGTAGSETSLFRL